MTHDKPDKFARPLSSEPAKPSRVLTWRQRLCAMLAGTIGSMIFPLISPFIVHKLVKTNPTPETIWLKAQQDQRLRRLFGEQLMRPRTASKFEVDDRRCSPARLKLASVLLALSVLAGGLTHKIMRTMHDLPAGDAFFGVIMAIGFIPLLPATLVLLLLRHRAMGNMIWWAATVVGLCLILLGTGYFEAYTW